MDLVYEIGMFYKDIFIIGCGDILEYIKGRMLVVGSIMVENIMIDGIGVGDIGNIVLWDCCIFFEDGIFVVVVIINCWEKWIVLLVKIIFRGFVYVKISKDLMKESSNIVIEIVEKYLESDDFEWSKLK